MSYEKLVEERAIENEARAIIVFSIDFFKEISGLLPSEIVKLAKLER